MHATAARLAAACGLLLALAAAPSPAIAEIVIYRCTDAAGALTVQNGEPCPKGHRQERSVMEPAPTMPVYVAAPQAVLAPVPVVAPVDGETGASGDIERPETPQPSRLAAADRLPPPPVYRCNTWDNDSYLSEDPAPKPRCVRIPTTGIGGLQGIGAGAACEMKYDQCDRVADGAACEGWRQRQREVESTWRHARGEDRPLLQLEFARIARILADTTCGG